MVQRAADSPATLAELSEAAGVHLNTARVHVADLEEAGVLVPEQAPPAGRGRPPQRYRIGDSFVLPSPGLSELLASALREGDPAPGELRRLGHEWGRGIAPDELERALPAALERLGFEARLDGSQLILSVCPCRLASPQRPELVCNLAIAVVEGVLAGCGSSLRVTSRSHDPERRRCSAVLAG